MLLNQGYVPCNKQIHIKIPGDVQMIEDYQNLKEEQQKRLMAYMEALKKIESLEDM